MLQPIKIEGWNIKDGVQDDRQLGSLALTHKKTRYKAF